MDRMNVPGFSAGASLYANTGAYRSLGAGYDGGHQQVVPQQNWLGDLGRQIWSDLKGMSKVLWETAECAYATQDMIEHCGPAGQAVTGPAGCADAYSEWRTACFD
jgi:hypothetical protein